MSSRVLGRGGRRSAVTVLLTSRRAHGKVTTDFVVAKAVLYAGAGVIVVFKKTDGDGDEKLISVFPLRPTLLHPLGVRPMFCKFQADETPPFVPCDFQESYEVNE